MQWRALSGLRAHCEDTPLIYSQLAYLSMNNLQLPNNPILNLVDAGAQVSNKWYHAFDNTIQVQEMGAQITLLRGC